MLNENNNVNKDVANSLGKYSDYENKGTNVILDSANAINNWYENQLNKILEGEFPTSRLETNVDNTTEQLDFEQTNPITSKIETKVDAYNELQTNNKNSSTIVKDNGKIKTQLGYIDISENNVEISENSILFNRKGDISKKISTTIKGVKLIKNTTNKVLKIGKSINMSLNESGLKSFENSSSRIMTKPIKKVANKASDKATNIVVKSSKKVAQKTTNTLVKTMKLLTKLVMDIVKIIISMLPSIAPILIIILIIICFLSFFGIGMNKEIRAKYEKYMIDTQNEYDIITISFYNQGYIVGGTIEGKGMINWKAPLSIIQMLNSDLVFDEAERELLNTFKNAGLYENITEENYTYEKTIEETNEDGNVNKNTETITETKKIVSNASLDDYLNWCSNNFSIINNYKIKKNLQYNISQTEFTDDEVQQIKLLYSSNSFFDLFSDNFKNTYAYVYVNTGDEQLQAIYNEFLQNTGKHYLMDHSNLKYDQCMDYYDCSSWVIHCFAHCGIKVIPNTTAQGIYSDYCYPVAVSDRKAGDLIFLKDTYDTKKFGSISHVGIYMGELNINGEKAEWVIDTRWKSIWSKNKQI